MKERVSFLYTGSDPIQQEVAADAIDPDRVAVLSGTVKDRAGEPLSGVKISILNHPEYGSTKTRLDGEFDMAVNGGGLVTVEYQKDGFLPVQRKLNPAWQDWARAEDVVMTQRTDKVTSIDLTSDKAMQVARGPGQSDSAGERQATLMFPQGTTAEITTPEGDTKKLSQLDVRATEYTVGDSGPEAMPGKLPPASAYTYAINLSVDQALEQGVKIQGKDVRFDQAVPFYVENFLDFPTGEAVPVGYYNNDTANWVPSDNGRIVEILDEQNGRAVLDVTGDGASATDAELAELGLTDTERMRLAELYEPGKSLWRFTTTHLSNWDCNWPYGPPDDAEGPDNEIPEAPLPEGSDEETPCPGCTISPQKQSLGESIDVAGTPFSLHYKSSRAEGAAENTVSIPLSDGDVPDSLQSIQVTIEIAGREVQKSFSPNRSEYTFTWDGRNGFGQTLHGWNSAEIDLAYHYGCVYKPGDNGFGEFGDAAEVLGTRERCQGFDLSRNSTVELKSPARVPDAVSNWSLSIDHRLQGDILIRGDAKQRDISPGGIIDTVAGGGTSCCDSLGDDVIATNVDLKQPQAVAVADDGHWYFSDTVHHRVFRVAPDGTIRVVAGNGERGFSGDGGPATQASLDSPNDLALGPGGDIYVSDGGNYRVRRIGIGGIIETVAGNGERYFDGDGGPAKEAAINPQGIDIGPDGSLYIADGINDRVRKVRRNGIIDTVAGKGQRYGVRLKPDGAPATEVGIGRTTDVALGPRGRLYISNSRSGVREYSVIRRVGQDGLMTIIAGAFPADFDYLTSIAVSEDSSVYFTSTSFERARVRRVTPDNAVTTIAGDSRGPGSGDGGPAADARLFIPSGIALGPRGDVYIADSRDDRIRRINSGVFSVTADDRVGVAAKSDDRRYIFDDAGRIIYTENTLTGERVYAFERDSEGRLIKVTDGDGNATLIERNPEGRATAIVAPDGQRTDLVVNNQGQLANVSGTSGGAWSMGYTSDGLMTEFTDRTGATNHFTYNDKGRLIKDEGPENSGWDIERAGKPDDYSVTMTSGAGRESVFSVKRPTDGKRIYTETAPDGSSRKRTYTDAGDTTIERANGTLITRTEGPDPRFGMAAPVVESETTETPGGLTRTVERDRTATVGEGEPLTEPEQLTESVTVNGRTTESVFDGGSKTWTTTTAEGRQSVREIDGQGRPVRTQLGSFAATQNAYDTRGRLSTVTRAANGTQRETSFSYATDGPDQGYLASITGPTDLTTEYERDANGRVLEQTRPDGETIGFEYDAEGRLTRVEPPGQPAHVMTYDGNGSRTTYDPPDADGEPGVTRYHFNADEQVTKVERPDGTVVDTTYAQGKRATVTAPVGTWNYSYNNQTGQLSGIDAPGGQSLSFQRDGQLLTQTQWSGPVTGAVSRTHDDSFRVTQRTAGGQAISFGYDQDSLLTSAGALSITRASDHPGVTGTTLDTVTTSRGYNAFGELSERSAETSGTSLYSADYERDRAGRITGETSAIEGTTTDYGYTYDDAGRLTEVTSSGGSVLHDYQYGPNGNRTSHTGPNGSVTAEYDAQDRLERYGDTSYSYNAAGDLESKTGPAGTTTYDYDARGNLRTVVKPDGTTIEYVIDGRNRRVGKKVNGTLAKGWLYKDGLNPVAQTDGQGTVTHRFVYGSKPNVPAYMIKDGTTYRIISDHLGSVRLVVNAGTGEVVQRMDYSPFGKVTKDTNAGFQPFGFAGGLYDPDTDLVRFGARDYDARTGQWTARDPIRFEGGQINLYGYVLSDPVNSIDPNGLEGWNVRLGIGGGYHLGTHGASGNTSVAVDSDGSVCMVYTTCSTDGVGAHAGGGLTVGGGSGVLCEGKSESHGIFGAGGKGVGLKGSISKSESGNVSGGDVVGPASAGVAGGAQHCKTTTKCLN